MDGTLELRTPRGRIVLLAVILASGAALLDGTVVNVALPRLGEDLGAGVGQIQWVVTGYLLSLAGLLLLGSWLGDRWGRRRMFLAGMSGFALTSAVCAIAPTAGVLIGVRVLQGASAAVLTPGALALIQATYRPEDRALAIGRWAGASGVAAAVGPFLGGFLVEHAGWRWIFVLNLPVAALVHWWGRSIPESRDDQAAAGFDLAGAVGGVVGLGALTLLLTGWRTLPAPLVAAAAVAGLIAVAVFAWAERRPGAMVPLDLFADRAFAATNAMTLLVYGALGAMMFFLVIQLQVVAGYPPTGAALATLPLPVTLALFSGRAARFAGVRGPRGPMSAGPLLSAVGIALLTVVGTDASYVVDVLPGMLLLSVGMTMMVAPLTATVLAAAPLRHAGVVSGINNAIARTGTLLAVAALPAAVGLHGEDYLLPARLSGAYREAAWWCVVMMAAAGLLAWRGLAPARTVEVVAER